MNSQFHINKQNIIDISIKIPKMGVWGYEKSFSDYKVFYALSKTDDWRLWNHFNRFSHGAL